MAAGIEGSDSAAAEGGATTSAAMVVKRRVIDMAAVRTEKASIVRYYGEGAPSAERM